MPSLRPQHRRGNGAVGVTLMRSANQFNNARRLGTNAQGKDGAWKPRGKPNDAKRMRLPRVGRRGTYAPHAGGGGNERVSRESRRSNRSIVRVSEDSSKLHEMNPRKHRAASHKAGGRARAACAAPVPLAPPRPSPHPQHPNETPRNGKIRAPCMIRGVRAAKAAPSWQDLRTVYSQTAVCRAFRMHGAHILPKPAHFGCMAYESCQKGAIFPSEATFGMHGAQNLPRIAARKRTRAKYCHRQAPENAPWRHGAGRRHANETSANSTPHAGTSKKP